MKLLLTAVNAKYIHPNPALYLLKKCAEKDGTDDVCIREFTINEYPDEILGEIYKEQPDFIGISCYIWNWKTVKWLTDEIKKVMPGVPVWLGGPEVSYNAEDVLAEHDGVDGIFTGEGEISFSEFVSLAEKNGKPFFNDKNLLEKVPGIVIRDGNGGYIRTPERRPDDLDELPFIYDDLEQFKNRIVYYETSRGCPYHCTYCVSSIENGIRLRSLPLVEKELQFFLDNKVPQVKFLDRTFNCSREHAYGIWKYIKEHDNGVTNFHFELEADMLTDDELDILCSMRHGLVQVEIGVQSTNSRTMEAVCRKTSFEHLKKAAGRLTEAGNMHVHLDLIAGLPYEDLESFSRSFDDVYALHPHELQLGFLKVLHGTPIEKQADMYGIKCTDEPPYEVLETDFLKYSDVIKLKRIEEVLEIYWNSGQFCFTMTEMERWFDSPFRMYAAIADHYEKMGYFKAPPSRRDRLNVLLEFINKKISMFCCLRNRNSVELYDNITDKVMIMFKEVMTFDIYLRENSKSRPGFAVHKSRGRRNEMRHEEVFDWPLWEIHPFGSGRRSIDPLKPLEKPVTIIFDYTKRDPVTKSVPYRIEKNRRVE